MNDKKNKGGRPSKYKSEYCEMLLQHMKDGFMFDTFAAVIEVNIDTLYEWVKRHPEFSDALKNGRVRELYWYEKTGKAAILGKIPNFNAAVYCFHMKNKFKWADKVEVEQTNNDKVTISYKLIDGN